MKLNLLSNERSVDFPNAIYQVHYAEKCRGRCTIHSIFFYLRCVLHPSYWPLFARVGWRNGGEWDRLDIWHALECTTTRYGLDGPGIESRWWRDFPHPPDRHWGPSSLMHSGYRVFPEGKVAGAWRWPPTPLAPWLKKELYLFPLRTFVACSSVNFNFAFIFTGDCRNACKALVRNWSS